MWLKNLNIQHFRNLERVDLPLSPALNGFCGANGQGKTNLLEAIFYLVTGRSFRSHTDGPVIPHGATRKTVLRIEGVVSRKEGGRHRLEVVIAEGAKRVWIDGKSVNQLGALWGRLRAVLFTPDDINILKGGPAYRRRMIDISLSQIDAAYLAALQNYARALKQRNALLREADSRNPPRRQILAFNRPLAQWAATIYRMRRRFIQELSSIAADHYLEIAGGRERLSLHYRNALKANETDDENELADRFAQLFTNGMEDDIRRHQTLRGIHREDVRFDLSGRDMRYYGSQGQLRTAMLCIRLAELKMMEQWCGEPPILLLDDLASELDDQRRSHLFQLIHDRVQTLLTTTNKGVVSGKLNHCAWFRVEDGDVWAEPEAQSEASND